MIPKPPSALPGETPPRFGVCQISTLTATFDQDLTAYRQGGAWGIGVCETKLPADRRDGPAQAAFRASGLVATLCVPATLSILPLPLLPGPEDPARRIEALCAGVRRLAAFAPAACLCLTGPRGRHSEAQARAIVVEGLRTVAAAAADVGTRIGLEPIHASLREDWTVVTSIPEAAALRDEVGAPNLGLVFDVWHLWDTPDVLAHARAEAHAIVGVHLSDRRQPTRSWADRVLPGDGVIDLPPILGALSAGGYTGAYDLEIFSDNGAFGHDFADSLWKRDPAELVRDGRARFLRAWQMAQTQ